MLHVSCHRSALSAQLLHGDGKVLLRRHNAHEVINIAASSVADRVIQKCVPAQRLGLADMLPQEQFVCLGVVCGDVVEAEHRVLAAEVDVVWLEALGGSVRDGV